MRDRAATPYQTTDLHACVIKIASCVRELPHLIYFDSIGWKLYLSVIWEANNAAWHAGVSFAVLISLVLVVGLQLLNGDASHLLDFDCPEVSHISKKH